MQSDSKYAIDLDASRDFNNMIVPMIMFAVGSFLNLINYVFREIFSRQPLPNENSHFRPNYYLCGAEKTSSSVLSDAQTTHARIYCKLKRLCSLVKMAVDIM